MSNVKEQTRILDCGHVVPESKIAWREQEMGEATERWSLCYDCARIELMDAIVMVGVIDDDMRLPVVYMSMDGENITTWDGQVIGRVTWKGAAHPFSVTYRDETMNRRYVNVRITYGADTVNAHGIGAPGEYCVLRRFKSDVPKRTGWGR